MPEHDLVLRTERALLGAVLREPHQIEQVSYLPAAAFTHPTYQAIYEHLQGSYPDPPRADQLPETVALQARIPGIDAAYLRSIAAACPDPGHATIYARMLQEAHVRTTLASFATTIAAEDPADLRLRQYNDILTQALARQGYVLTDAAREELAPANASHTTNLGIYETPADERARREEIVLADLLQHQQQVAEVQTWLSPEVFAPGPRRELFETIVTIDGYGEPVTELTIEWELSRRRYQPQPQATQPDSSPEPGPAATRPEVPSQYLDRLMTMAVTIGTAVELGNDLLGETLRADLAKHAAKALANIHPGQPAGAEHAEAHSGQGFVTPRAQMKQQPSAPANPQLLAPPPTSNPASDQPKPRI
jgi:hypothetical protein